MSRFEELSTYVEKMMPRRMQHVYQPVMIAEILRKGGTCSEKDLAEAILSFDQSQIEYYEIQNSRHGWSCVAKERN